MLYAIVGLLFLLADQFLKFWTVSHIELNAFPGKELIPGILNLTYIKNTGIAFGLFGENPMLRWVLLGLLVLFTAFVIGSLCTGWLRSGLARWSGVLLLTGLLGNGVDRAIYGYVVDMLEPKLGSISWPIFNIADALILIFGILFCIALLTGGFGKPRRRKGSSGRRPRRDRSGAEARPARKPRPEAARSAAAHKGERRPRPEGTQARSRRAEEADAAKRAPERAEQSESVVEPAKERPGRVTEAAAAETLRRSGSTMRPAEPPMVETVEAVEDIVPPVKEETPVETVDRPAPAQPSAGDPSGDAIPKPSIEDMDLDSILAEFK